MESLIQGLVDEYILQCRLQVKDKGNVKILLDGGWSHPGWWANECCIYALDADTSLPIARKYVVRNKNFQGTSKAMEGWAAQEIAKELASIGFKVSKLVHDKDASSMKHFKEYYPDVKEEICSGR